MVEAVRKCDGNARFAVCSKTGHGISDVTYENREFLDWLLTQRRVRRTSTPATSH
jgi:hypothetical protein